METDAQLQACDNYVDRLKMTGTWTWQSFLNGYFQERCAVNRFLYTFAFSITSFLSCGSRATQNVLDLTSIK